MNKGKLILEERTMTATLTLNDITVELASDILALVKTAQESEPEQEQQGEPLFEEITPSSAKTETEDKPEPEYAVEDIRSAFVKYAQSQGKDAAKELLGKYGASKVTEIPPEKYADIMKEVS